MGTRYLGTMTAVRKGEGDTSPCCSRPVKQGHSVALFLLNTVTWLGIFLLSAVVSLAISAGSNQASALALDTLSLPQIKEKLILLNQNIEQMAKQSGREELLPISEGTEVADEKRVLVPLEVPMDNASNSGFKAYMDFRALTNRASTQYLLQQDAYTNEAGFRMHDGYYMVALGTFYAQSAGEKFHIVLDSGVGFDVITGDIKSDAHTDSKHQHRNGNIVEFIVDTKLISRECRVRGDMSYAGFEGRILEIHSIVD